MLKPGGRLAIHDVVEGANGPLAFPVPWAPTPQSNSMLTSDAMRSALIEAGFEILSWEDKTAVTLAGPPKSPVGDAGSTPPPPPTFVLAGPEYPRMVETFLRNLRVGRAGVVQVIAARR